MGVGLCRAKERSMAVPAVQRLIRLLAPCPCETIISAYTGETPMLPWPLCLTPFPRTSGFLSLKAHQCLIGIGLRRAKERSMAVPAVQRLIRLHPIPIRTRKIHARRRDARATP